MSECGMKNMCVFGMKFLFFKDFFLKSNRRTPTSVGKGGGIIILEVSVDGVELHNTSSKLYFFREKIIFLCLNSSISNPK